MGMVVYYLEYLGYSVELPAGELVVGRDVRCALRFNDPAISRRHLRFVCADGVVVEDLGSSNGTRVNGRRIDGPTRIADRDEIEIGARTLRFRAVDAHHDEQPSTRRVTSFAALVDVGKPSRTAASRVASRPTIEPHERRAHERHAVALDVTYRSSELEVEATSRDLSHSGVFVSTAVLEPIGTRCELTILLDGGPPLTVHGIVRRVVERGTTGLGIEFVDVGDAERRWLDVAVAQGGDTQQFAAVEP